MGSSFGGNNVCRKLLRLKSADIGWLCDPAWDSDCGCGRELAVCLMLDIHAALSVLQRCGLQQ